MLGNTRASDLRKTAEEIGRFRLAMRSLLPALRTDPPAPVVAVVFRDDNAMTPFKPRDRGKPIDNVAAYFSPLPDVNYIVMAIGRREFTYRVIFHEYTHLLVHQNIRQLPRWLDEGLAEVYSTFDGSERDGRLIVGRPIPEHVSLLGGLGTIMPLDKFIIQTGSPICFGTTRPRHTSTRKAGRSPITCCSATTWRTGRSWRHSWQACRQVNARTPPSDVCSATTWGRWSVPSASTST